jgi:hypothetical protein
MTLADILGHIRTGARARRPTWHNGLIYVYVPEGQGMAEPMLRYRQGSAILDQPYTPRRADWYADDWMILSAEDLPALEAPVTPPASDPSTTTDPA